MTPAQYQAFTVSNWSKGRKPSPLRSLAIMALGVTGEAGEIADMIKKHIRTGKPMDVEALTLELGDELYYLARTAALFGIKLDDVMAKNVRKLQARNKRNKNWRVEKNT